MFTSSLTVCKHLVSGRTFKLMCCSVAQSHRMAERANPAFARINREDPTRLGISFTTKYLNELERPEDVQWDDLMKQLRDQNIEKPCTKIFQACIRLNKLTLGMDYYNYLTEKGIQLSPVELLFFSKLLLKEKKQIKEHEEVLIKLYYSIRDILVSSSLIRDFILEVFMEIPECFSDIVKRLRNSDSRDTGNWSIIRKALELNMPDTAFEFMDVDNFSTDTKIIDNYIQFCIRQVEEGKFSRDLLNKFVNLCAEKAVTLNHVNLLNPLESFVKTINEHQNDSYWSVRECELSGKHVCSNCGLTLLPHEISDEEFTKLREHFLEAAFIENNIFLNSTKTELQKFLLFLKNSQPYNLVLDGLNMYYKNKRAGFYESNQYLKYFLDNGFKVLTIGREHCKVNLTKGKFLNQSKYRKNVQFFFTSNMSDDDLFLLYATLYGGRGTFFLTGDYLGTYVRRVSQELKSIFMKWQLSHQFLISPDRKAINLVPPHPHCGLPQLTLDEKDRHVWHLSQQHSYRTRINLTRPIRWYCLTEKKKNKMEEL